MPARLRGEPLGDAVEDGDVVIDREGAGEGEEIDGVEVVVRLRRLGAEVVADIELSSRGVQEEDAHVSTSFAAKSRSRRRLRALARTCSTSIRIRHSGWPWMHERTLASWTLMQGLHKGGA